MNQNPQATICQSCQTANAPGVKFCAQCGAPLAVAAAPLAPRETVPANHMERVRAALTGAHASVTGGDGQTTLDYQLKFSDKLLAGPVALQFAGTVTRATDGTTGHTVTARMLPQSMAVLFGMCVAGAVVAGFIPRSIMSNDMFVGAVAVTLAVTAWTVFSGGPQRVRRHVEGLVNASTTGTPVTTTAAPTPAAVTSSAAGNGDVFAQLERLAQLQATGLLTAEDVTTKKAELLKRI